MAESIGLFLSSTCPNPVLPPSSFLSVHPMPLSFTPSSSLLLSPSNFSCVLTIEMSSLSPVEQGITAQVDWFNTAVRSPFWSWRRCLLKDIWPLIQLQPFCLFYSLFCLSSMINRLCGTMAFTSIWWKREAYYGLGKINIRLLLLFSLC